MSMEKVCPGCGTPRPAFTAGCPECDRKGDTLAKATRGLPIDGEFTVVGKSKTSYFHGAREHARIVKRGRNSIGEGGER